MKREKGITLIALVITIIVMLILAAVTINLVLNGNIIGKSQAAVDSYKYVAAKEQIMLKMVEIKFDCMSSGREYTLEELAENIRQSEDITIEKYYSGGTAKLKEGVEIPGTGFNLAGIAVSVDSYEECKFLINKDREIAGVSIGEKVPETMSEFLKIEGEENNVESIAGTVIFDNTLGGPQVPLQNGTTCLYNSNYIYGTCTRWDAINDLVSCVNPIDLSSHQYICVKASAECNYNYSEIWIKLKKNNTELSQYIGINSAYTDKVFYLEIPEEYRTTDVEFYVATKMQNDTISKVWLSNTIENDYTEII